MPWGSSVQSAATVDTAANYHWFSQEREVAVAQREEPNFYWLLGVRVAGSREAWQWVAPLLDEAAQRYGRLVEEEEVAGAREAFVGSSGGTPKLV